MPREESLTVTTILAALADTFDITAIPPAFAEDPFPTYRALLEHAPVKHFADGSIMLSRYADLDRVYRDTKAFSSDKKVEFLPKFGQTPLYEHHTTSLVFNDPPLHTRVRKRLSPAFAPRALNVLEPRFTVLVDRLLDAAEARGSMDLIVDFAAALPVEIIGDMLGVPRADRGPLRGWSLAQFAGSTPVLSVFAVAATFATGFVTDRFHSTVMLPVMLAAMAVATLALGTISSTVAILVFMAGMGVAFGVYSVVLGAIWPELYGTRHLGAVKSLVTAIMVFASAIGPGLSGWLIDAGVSLPVMIQTMAGYAAVAAVLVLFAEPVARKRAAVRKSIPVEVAAP